jgi:type IV pilus assembly protein PilC
MFVYEYSARDNSSGKKVQATVKADSEAAAAKLIVKEGLSPIEIKVQGGDKSKVGGFKNRVRTKDRVLFARQLSTLIGAGLPLVQSLRTVQEQTGSKPLQAVVSQVIGDIEAGQSLNDALSHHPNVFNPVFVSLVASGETSGTLDSALERLAEQLEKDAELSSKVKGAMVYPGIVLVVIFGVVIFMLTSVLPQVELLYEDLGKELPFLTGIMIALSKALLTYWYLFILVIVGGVFMLRRYFKTTSGVEVIDGFKMNVPIFGKLFMKMYMARFSRTGGTLMQTGVPMLEMMRITGDSVDNIHIKRATDRAADKVKTGKALSETLMGDTNFLPLVPQMIRIGEQSGSLDAMMLKTALYYENELDREIKTITSTIEPILMVFLALIAGLMVGAILLPIYSLVGESIAL